MLVTCVHVKVHLTLFAQFLLEALDAQFRSLQIITHTLERASNLSAVPLQVRNALSKLGDHVLRSFLLGTLRHLSDVHLCLLFLQLQHLRHQVIVPSLLCCRCHEQLLVTVARRTLRAGQAQLRLLGLVLQVPCPTLRRVQLRLEIRNHRVVLGVTIQQYAFLLLQSTLVLVQLHIPPLHLRHLDQTPGEPFLLAGCITQLALQ
jgi:hypothetical protein